MIDLLIGFLVIFTVFGVPFLMVHFDKYEGNKMYADLYEACIKNGMSAEEAMKEVKMTYQATRDII